MIQQVNVDVGFLQETNLTQGIQTRKSALYNVWETEADSWDQEVVAVVL